MLRKADQPHGIEVNSPTFDSGPLASRRRLVFIPVLILISLATLIAIQRLITYREPFDRDTMLYSVVGHELLAGRALYSDLWDHKPPAIYLTFAAAEFLFGYGHHTLLVLHITVSLITLLGVYSAGSAGTGGVSTGLWAAAFWAVLSNNYDVQASDPNTEIFINACLVWTFALFVRADSGSSSLGRPLAIGALLALASLFKPLTIVSALFLSCVHIAFPPPGLQSRRRALIEVCVIAAVGLIAWAAVFIYFAARGRFAAFYDAIFTYNRFYAGDIKSNILASLLRKVELFKGFLEPLAILTFLGAVIGIFKSSRSWALLIAFVAAAWIEVMSLFPGYPHYHQLWLPPLVVGASWSIGLLGRLPKRGRKWLPHVAGAALLVILFMHELPGYQKALANDWSRIENPPNVMDPRAGCRSACEELAQEVNAMLAPNESFYYWGTEAGLFFWSRRRPPAGVLNCPHLLRGPLAHDLSLRVVADLEREQPELFIDATPMELRHETFGRFADHPVIRWLTERYRRLPRDPDKPPFDLYVRRGGKLEARLDLNEDNGQNR